MSKTKRLTICPTCRKKTVQFIIGDLNIERGNFKEVPYEKCSNCNEIFLSSESYKIIEQSHPLHV